MDIDLDVQMISFNRLVLCFECRTFSDSRGDTCPACGERGTLLNVARMLQPTPELGAITWLYAGGTA